MDFPNIRSVPATAIIIFIFGVIHKPRGQLRGRGLPVSHNYHKPYLVKVFTKGKGPEGAQNNKTMSAWFMYGPFPLRMATDNTLFSPFEDP